MKIPVISEKKDWRPICTVVAQRSPGYSDFRSKVTHGLITESSSAVDCSWSICPSCACSRHGRLAGFAGSATLQGSPFGA